MFIDLHCTRSYVQKSKYAGALMGYTVLRINQDMGCGSSQRGQSVAPTMDRGNA
jgi:hypothetical protein